MIFPVEKYRLVYGSVPKAACTSLKLAMYQLENGRPFEPVQRDGKTLGIHWAQVLEARPPSDLPAYSGYWRFAVVRDPASRVLSTWSNKVIDDGRLEKRHKWETGLRRRVGRALRGRRRPAPLDPRPSIDTFATRIADYVRRYPEVEHHVRTVSRYLGPDLSLYDRIYTTDELPILEADIRKRTGLADFKLPRANESSTRTKVSLDDLSDEAFETLIDWLAPEYELLSAWFEPPTRTKLHTSKTGTF